MTFSTSENDVSTLAPSFLIGSSSYLQVTRTSITSRTSSKFGQIGPRTAELAALERMKNIPWTCGKRCHHIFSAIFDWKNDVAPFSRLFFMGSFSYLQVMTTYIRAWMSLKFGQIRPRTTELAALKRLKKMMFSFFLALYNRSHVRIVALWATCFNFYQQQNKK